MNHIIPVAIEEEAKIALSYYPELADTYIEFRFKDGIKKSTMQAQPTYTSFLRSRKNRSYIILMNRSFKIEDEEYLLTSVPKDVLIGWLGHELGHVMDYRGRGTVDMLWFGFKYLYSGKHIKEVERAADTYAVKHGMKDYILATKNFILNNSKLSQAYKDRIRKFYMSPEEIMELVAE
ncbi:hypothetical protein GCM10009117_10640 [Gangjinia marincola]|uniref:Uncharacterized protein n=1 Tax=Gangjinia marincola TaxID=578463 RepID=A0ABN1MFK0_9FLAO